MTITPLARRPAYNPHPVITVDGQRFDKIDQLLQELDMREQEGGCLPLN